MKKMRFHLVSINIRSVFFVFFGSFFLLLILVSVIVFVNYRNQKQQMESLASVASSKIEQIVSYYLMKTDILAGIIMQGSGDTSNLELVAETITDDPNVRNILLAPDGIVTDVYPLAGNESVLGLNLLAEGSNGNKEAILAKKTGLLTMAGPFELIQGGQAITGRLPIYLKDKDGDRVFWGIVAITLNYPEVLDELGLDEYTEYAYQLWRINPDTETKQVILSTGEHGLYQPFERTISVYNVDWIISIAPASQLKLVLLTVGGILLSGVLSVLLAFIWFLMNQYRTYDRQISDLIHNQQTFDLAWGNLRTKSFLSKGDLTFFRKWGLDLDTGIDNMDELNRAFGYNLYIDYATDMHEMKLLNKQCVIREKEIVSPINGNRMHYRRYLHRLNDDEFMACLTDITEEKQRVSRQKENERILREAMLREQEASKSKSVFLANMSHEIRTPMNGIIGLADLAIDDDMISEKTADYLAKIRNSANGLLLIINDILDISKVEAGEMVLEQIPFDLYELFTECRIISSVKADEKGIMLYFYLEEVFDRKIIGDPTKLRQVLLNLLSNSIKFTKRGMVKLMTMVEIRDDCAVIEFQVKDSGIGMTEEQMANVFEPFKQADGSTTRKYGGTGLGLAIVKNLVEMMGGEVQVRSVLDIGSTFSFTLTFALSDEPIVKSKAKENVFSSIQKPTFDGIVLVCEDNRTNQQVATEHLKKIGLHAVVAENGKEGVERVQEQLKNGKPFDLIFMDIQMPIMDGFEATKNLLQMGVTTPIIAMTANAMSSDRERCLKVGMADYISKPFQAQGLWTCIMRYLTPIDTVVEQKAEAAAHEQQIIQTDIGLANSADDETLYRKLLFEFYTEPPIRYKDLVATIDRGDRKLAHRMVHTAKSVANTIGALQAAAVAQLLENELSGEGKDIDEHLLHRFQVEWEQAVDAVRAMGIEKGQTIVSEAALDTDKGLELIARLKPMLDKGMTDSLEYVDEIVAVLSPLGETCERLLKEIEDYEFGMALDTLTEIERVLNDGM